MDDIMKQLGHGQESASGGLGFSEEIAFPATKDQILDQARKKHLPPDVLQQLERLPDKKYDNVSDLIASAVKGS